LQADEGRRREKKVRSHAKAPSEVSPWAFWGRGEGRNGLPNPDARLLLYYDKNVVNDGLTARIRLP